MKVPVSKNLAMVLRCPRARNQLKRIMRSKNKTGLIEVEGRRFRVRTSNSFLTRF